MTTPTRSETPAHQVSQPTTTPLYLPMLPRAPRSFHREVHEDVDDCMEHFERFASFNNWADIQMLDDTYFSLKDTACSWFENREATLTSSPLFQQETRRAFAGNHRREGAEDTLRTRIQQPKETVTSFIEDVLRLLGRADPNKTDERKIHFFIRGVKREIFNIMFGDPPTMVYDFVTIATRIERVSSSRSRHRQRLPEWTSLESQQLTAGVEDSLEQAIHDILQE